MSELQINMSEQERREYFISVFGYGRMDMQEDGYRIRGFESMDRTKEISRSSTFTLF